MRIALFNQIDFPLAAPVFQLLLAGNGLFHRFKGFVVNKSMDFVARGESGKSAVSVLPEPTNKMGRYANIERSVSATRKDVGAGKALLPHASDCVAGWMLKQVQHDEYRGSSIT